MKESGTPMTPMAGTGRDTSRVWMPLRFQPDAGRFAVCPFCARLCALAEPETRCAHWGGETRTHEESGEPAAVLFTNEGGMAAPVEELTGAAEGMLSLGRVNMTPGAVRVLAGPREFLHGASVDPLVLLGRHRSGDWGDLDRHDWAVNDRAAREGGRVLSAYKFYGGVIFWTHHRGRPLPDDAAFARRILILTDEY